MTLQFVSCVTDLKISCNSRRRRRCHETHKYVLIYRMAHGQEKNTLIRKFVPVFDRNFGHNFQCTFGA